MFEEAAELIHVPTTVGNTGGQGFLDLHGMSVPMALAACRSRLKAEGYKADEPAGVVSTSLSSLLIVTGRGKHSADGQARVREEVREFFDAAFEGLSEDWNLATCGTDGVPNVGAFCLHQQALSKWRSLEANERERRLFLVRADSHTHSQEN
jgi:hypothetical protein